MALERRAEEQQYRPISWKERESPLKPTRAPSADRGWAADGCGVDPREKQGARGERAIRRRGDETY